MDETAVFGIALGTASASIALNKGSKTEILANHAGERTTPTLVSYRYGGAEVVGHAAKQSLHRNAPNTASHMTQLIGKDFDDEEVGEIASTLTCDVGRGEGGRVCYVIPEDGGKQKEVKVSDSLTLVLRSLHETAGSFSGSGEKSAVVAVAADCKSAQRNAIRLCCEEAGFDVMRVIFEPAAICLAHGIGQMSKTQKSHVLVYNLGAHTLTLSLLLVAGGMYSQLVTRRVCEGVGGEEFDSAIADFLSSEFEKQWKVSIRGNRKCRFKLLAAAESAKHALSTVHTTSVHVESLHDGLDFTYSLSRGRFEGLCTAVFRRCVNSDLISEVLLEGGVAPATVDQVIIAGGSCKIPLIQSLLTREFPNSEIIGSPSSSATSPEEAVVVGCALQAGLMREGWEGGEDVEGEGVEIACVPHDLWIKCEGLSDYLLLPSLTPLPSHTALTLQPETNSSPCALVLCERSNDQDREIAKVSVPLVGGDCEIGEGVKVTLVWTADNVITMTTTKSDSDWSNTLSLSCEISD